MEVGAFGLGMGARHRDDAYCNQGEIYRLNNTSKNAPGNQVYGVLSLPCDGGPSGGYLAVQNNADAFIGRSNITDNGVTWFQVYTTRFKPKAQDVDAVSATLGGEFKKEIQASGGVTVANSWSSKPGGLFPGNGDGASYETCNVDVKSWYGLGFFNTCKGEGIQGRTAFLNVRTGSFSAKGRITGASVWDGNARVYSPANKPTAADVGALTDAQAAQKYALRSIRVNGKPLSADVNLLASDVNAWNKTEADGRFVKQAGDTMSGPLALPRVVFPSEGMQALNADSDLTRPDGFMLEQLGDKSTGYPLKKGNLGNLMTFKVNKYRHVQFAIGSGNTEFWLRSLREDNPATAKAWAQVYTTDSKPTISDVGAADQSNNFAARMGSARVLTGADKPTSPGVWSVENSSWTPVAWGTLYVTTNGTNLSTASGNGKFIHYLFIAHGSANKFYVATDVNGGFTGWESYLTRKGGQLSGTLTSSAEITAKYLSTPTGATPEGSGAFSSQLDTKAPFYQENYNWDVVEGGRYVPLVKGKSTRKGQGYPTAVSFGYLMDGAGSFAKPCIHVRGDNNAEAIWRFDPNTKQFVAPGNLYAGGAAYQVDGNISGSIWGGYLSNWLNQNFNGRVDWGTYNRDVGARATIDYVNSRSAVAGGRNAWWYKDEVTGFIIQGGVVNRVDYVNRVGFPRAYARECFGVQLTLASSNGNWFGDSRVNIQARDLDNNGFNAMMDGQEQVVFWQSVGV
ncbi:tail fiber protein [Serratia ureilytica]|uniref:tail fiber protein n=1 Tax=Serratia ureilytica TaxID=300181 RepID=UPI00313E65B2